MEKISLHSNIATGVTVVPNVFIDKYMPSANGAYVKVYLYLWRYLSSPSSHELTISSIADSLDHTENDIIRALCYWEKVNVLLLGRNSDNQIINITFNTLDNDGIASEPDATASVSTLNNTKNRTVAPRSYSYTACISTPTPVTNSNNFGSTTFTTNVASSNAYNTDNMDFSDTISKTVSPCSTDLKEVEFVISIAEKYIERILTPNDEQLILYLYTKANFSEELILELYEYCASQGKKHYKYIEAVANAWIKKGIDTVEKAKASMQSFNSYYSAVTKEFGINRPLGQIEKDYVDNWINKYSFDVSIIKEACKRTLLTIQKPDFKYTERILKSWFNKNVHTLNDVTVIDEQHSKSFSNNNYYNSNHNTATPKQNNKYSSQKGAVNKFNAFPQREYSEQEMKELEKILLSR